MKLEEQVCSLDFSKKLKELGVNQTNPFCFYHAGKLRYEGEIYSVDNVWNDKVEVSFDALSGDIPAFTVAELGELLPRTIEYPKGVKHVLRCTKELFDGGVVLYGVSYLAKVGGVGGGAYRREADARASMLVWLIENKVIDV